MILEKKIEELKKYLQEKNYEKVILESKIVAKKFPDNLVILNFLGVAQNLNNQIEVSISTFKKILAIDNSQIQVQINLASAFKKNNQFREAIKLYLNLFTGEKNSIKYGIDLMNCYFSSKNFDRCTETCKKILSIDKNNFDALMKISETFYVKREYQKAINYLNLAKNIDEKNINVLTLLAVVYFDISEYKKSENLYKLILSLSNKSSDYYYIYNNLGLLYEEQGNIKEAENNFIIGLDMRPDDEILNRSFALLLIKNNKIKESIQYLKKGGDRCKSHLLKAYYELDLRKEYNNLLDSIIIDNPFSMRIASITEFASEQNNMTNKYPLCPNNISLLRHLNIDKELNIENFSYEKLLIECQTKELIWEPKESNTVGGYQTFGDIFSMNLPNINILKANIERAIKKYKSEISLKNKTLFTEHWPKEMYFKSWLVDLQDGGWQASHIHSTGWLSGVFYIDIPLDITLDEGFIEFTKYGETSKPKKISEKKIINPKQGDLVLFPASLFHRTHPFKSKKNRICIGFDLMPEEEIIFKNKMI